jgi:hypothetical protein
MEVSWSPGSHQPRFATINGRLQSWPLVEIDGVEAGRLPFLDGNWHSIPSYFPWKTMEVANADSIYSISDSEHL